MITCAELTIRIKHDDRLSGADVEQMVTRVIDGLVLRGDGVRVSATIDHAEVHEIWTVTA